MIGGREGPHGARDPDHARGGSRPAPEGGR